MKHKIILFLFLAATISLSAQKLQRLSDSLTVYVKQYADVGIVEVKSCREKGERIEVRTNPVLSYVSFSPAELQALREQVSLWVRGDKRGKVSLYSDGHELSELLTSRFRSRQNAELRPIRPAIPLISYPDAPYTAKKGLNGHHIALWGSHGKYYIEKEDRWIWQRARLWTTVEDLFTSSFTMPFLVPMLENSGAVVLQPRERDTQTKERISLRQGTTPHSLAMPQTDQYALYIRYTARPAQSDKALYSVMHEGVTTTFLVNQQIGGQQWLYVGTFTFGPDSLLNHLTIQDGSGKHLPLSHEGIKIGGGIGTSGSPRYMEAARYRLIDEGLPDTVYTYEKERSDYLDDLVSRGRWVNYMQKNLHIPISMAIAVHSDAGVRGGDSIVGTLAIYAEKDKEGGQQFTTGGSRMIGRDLADLVQTQIVSDMQRTICPNWARRELKNGGYAEARIPKVPTLLIEVLSHQNINDMRYGLDSRTKFIISRAIYKGMLRFLHQQDGTPYIVQPLPVQAFGMQREGDSIRLSWQERVDTLEPTAHPTYYIVYTREEGKDWDNGTRCSTRYLHIPLSRGKRYDFCVAAGNEGGISLRSEQLSAYISPSDSQQALIINGFTQVSAPRFFATDSLFGGIVPHSYAIPYGKEIAYIGEQVDYERQHQWVSDDECGFGMCANDFADIATVGNTFDYPTLHGRQLQELGWSYISTSIAAWDTLPQVQLIDLILGKQAEGIAALSEKQRERLTAYLQDKGKLLVSGSYIASGAEDTSVRMWGQLTLHYRLKAPRASQSGRIFFQLPNQPTQTYQLSVTPNDQRIVCEAPDGIEPVMAGQRLARYADSAIGAAVSTAHQIIILPFMPESATDFPTLYKQCINYLNQS